MAHVENLRRHFPAVRYITYLNTGNSGALPDATVEAVGDILKLQLEQGRGSSERPGLAETASALRQELSHVFSASPQSFSLVSGVAQAASTVLWGLDLMEGDEILLTRLNHQDILLPAFIQKQRRGVKLRYIDGTLPADALVRELTNHLTARTKIIMLPQVSYSTGHRLPVEQVIEAASRNGVPVFVDGGHAAGAEEVALDAMKPDFYAVSGHKWLCGPDGTGFLYMDNSWIDRLQLTHMDRSLLAYSQAYDDAGHYLPASYAQRFDSSITDLPKWTAFLKTLQFMRVTVGFDYSYTHVHGLSGELIDSLLDLSGVKVLTPREARAGIVSFQMTNSVAKKFVREATARQIDLGWIPSVDAVRVSMGVYNNSGDIERVVKLIQELNTRGQ
ncbi:aminotransferase class V-fold PLP-dependent enzyme [Alicyclobacillus sp. SO9]|uniref:aminotransferase class V-fold PLP-dependent enzyme n=1 Tax=Alicyclobacillus sp. SO9 TaxID=2665646 RepID=UPI0018E718D6|nr:aminotransferase class V-fold PLP-dependent enzyme [Alicyclobacillus sp. SO9]QQE77395.1 aminotransferase class V-fold PLP-dependent enzyme [Alicyclobacillus sp. SO9]